MNVIYLILYLSIRQSFLDIGHHAIEPKEGVQFKQIIIVLYYGLEKIVFVFSF